MKTKKIVAVVLVLGIAVSAVLPFVGAMFDK